MSEKLPLFTGEVTLSSPPPEYPAPLPPSSPSTSSNSLSNALSLSKSNGEDSSSSNNESENKTTSTPTVAEDEEDVNEEIRQLRKFSSSPFVIKLDRLHQSSSQTPLSTSSSLSSSSSNDSSSSLSLSATYTSPSSPDVHQPLSPRGMLSPSERAQDVQEWNALLDIWPNNDSAVEVEKRLKTKLGIPAECRARLWRLLIFQLLPSTFETRRTYSVCIDFPIHA